MDRKAARPCSSTACGDAKSRPFADILVTLSKQEHIELVWAAKYWKVEHGRAAERALSVEALYQDRLRQVTERAQERESALLCELETAHPKIRDLQQRLFGRKTERGSLIDDKHRGGQPGHGDADSSVERPVMVVRGRRICRCAPWMSNSPRRRAPSAAKR